MAIGTYSATPLEMVAAYTVFANGGVRLPVTLIRAIRVRSEEQDKSAIEEGVGSKTTVLDPRVTYVVTDMLREVLSTGTAHAVRSSFDAPAAGKTGSSHDAWFAGYTSNLLCIVWVGNDDYSDIKLDGARAAAPIWADFMRRARKLSQYHDMQPFTAPPGVVSVQVDKASNLPANETCPDDYDAYFVDGTVPAATCNHPEGPSRNVFERMFGLGKDKETVLPPLTPPTPPAATGTNPPQPENAPPTPPAPQPNPDTKPKKKGFWHRLFGGGKSDRPPGDTQTPQN
jgi:penicillin-binding protein 1B